VFVYIRTSGASVCSLFTVHCSDYTLTVNLKTRFTGLNQKLITEKSVKQTQTRHCNSHKRKAKA